MKLVKLNQAEKFNNSDKCEVLEYNLNDKDINFAIGKITGRYPDTGYCINEECKELIYVLDGYGTLYKKDGEKVEFNKGDLILIEKGEAYYWDAHCEVIMPCTPAWYPEQHKLIEE